MTKDKGHASSSDMCPYSTPRSSDADNNAAWIIILGPCLDLAVISRRAIIPVLGLPQLGTIYVKEACATPNYGVVNTLPRTHERKLRAFK